MKNFILTLALTVTSISAFAQTATLDQQLSFTRDAISRLTQDLQVRDSAGGLRLTDYRVWEAKFKKDMEKHFAAYEQGISQRVFGPLKEVLGKMNAVAQDQSLEEDQKDALLLSYKNQLDMIKPSIEAEYANLIQTLYHSHNLLPSGLIINSQKYYSENGKEVRLNSNRKKYEIQNVSYVYSDKKKSSLSFDDKTWKFEYVLEGKSRNCEFFYSYKRLDSLPKTNNCGSNDLQAYLYAPLYLITATEKAPYEVALERIIRNCNSKSCIILKSSELVFWYQSIKNLIDKEIRFVLPCKEEVINRWGEKTGKMKDATFVINPTNLSLAPYMAILKRTDFSESINAMPFDI